jgi:glutamate/tyrosine decarboxylase-like PLP-dependent enzyme
MDRPLHRTAAELVARLATLTLGPDEENRGRFLDQVATSLAAVPPPAHPAEAVVGGAAPDTRWLAGFEELADAGADPEATVAAAMRALDGQIRWHSPYALHNVNPPTLLPAAAAAAVTSLYNPNALWDLVSGGFLDLERQVVRQLAGLVRWDPAEADGLFTFGGKGGILYAIRLGLNRCLPGSAAGGLSAAARPAVLTTSQNHYSIRSACALLGLGRDAVVDVPTVDGRMDVTAFRSAVTELTEAGRPLACVVLCGGNTLDAVVDPVAGITAELDRLPLATRPWVHLDLPLGWPWLFFDGYDFDRNPLALSAAAVAAARAIAGQLSGTDRADSTSFDFHKLGFCPYSTSVFATRHWQDIRTAFGEPVPAEPWLAPGENFRQHHSIEHSRSAAPIAAAWVTLRVLGRDGFRACLGHLHDLTALLREELTAAGMRMLNPAAPSLATLFVPPVPGDTGDPDRQNVYTESLFRRVSGMDGGVERPLSVGFVPAYMVGADGVPLAALRIYLANPLLDRPGLRAAVEHFCALKRDFDEVLARGFAVPAATRLVHTPR